MSWSKITLLWALFLATFLVQVRLPLRDLSANNLLVPLCALGFLIPARAAVPAVARRLRRFLAATLVLYAWVWVSSCFSLDPALSLRYAAKHGLFLLAFLAFLVLLRRREALVPALRAVFLLLVGLAALAVVEYQFPTFSPFVVLRGRLHVYPRVASLFVWPNQLGVLTAIAISLGAALRRRGDLHTPSFYAAVAVLLPTLALTGSRNGWFVFAALLALLGTTRLISLRELVVIGAAFVVLVLSFVVPAYQLGLQNVPGLPLVEALRGVRGVRGDYPPLTAPGQTLAPRLQLWSAAAVEIRKHPVTGIGLEVFAHTIGPDVIRQHGINTHNLLLDVATGLGLVGLGLFLWWAWELARHGDRRYFPTSLPLLGIALGQVFDCFTYDYSFVTFASFFAAAHVGTRRNDH